MKTITIEINEFMNELFLIELKRNEFGYISREEITVKALEYYFAISAVNHPNQMSLTWQLYSQGSDLKTLNRRTYEGENEIKSEMAASWTLLRPSNDSVIKLS